MKKILLPSLLSIALLGGCSTQTVQLSKDLSSSGIAYTEAVDNLLDTATDKIIDFDNSELIKSRHDLSSKLKLEKDIAKNNEVVSAFIVEINSFRSQTRLLKAYFLNLQKLSDSSIKEDMGDSVKSLSDSISKLNKPQSLSDGQKEQIGKLGGLIASVAHSSKIKRVLERDAEVIGAYLALHGNQIENILKSLEERVFLEIETFLRKEVITPYSDTRKKLGSDWSDNRKKWFKIKFVNEKFDTAKKAAKQLQGLWENILRGKSDASSLSGLISDLNELVEIVQLLDCPITKRCKKLNN